jgi:hypothetical protein
MYRVYFGKGDRAGSAIRFVPLEHDTEFRRLWGGDTVRLGEALLPYTTLRCLSEAVYDEANNSTFYYY